MKLTRMLARAVGLCALPIVAFASEFDEPAPTVPAPNGYLLFEMIRHEYSDRSDHQLAQKFKARVNAEFLANLVRQPTEASGGTSFGCHGGRQVEGPTVDFSWWVSPTTQGRLKSWGWSSGTELVHGEVVNARNPTVTSIVGFADWTHIDWLLEPSFTRWSEDMENVWGVNLSFAVRFVPANALSRAELAAIPNVPVTDVYGRKIVRGSTQRGLSHGLECFFQN